MSGRGGCLAWLGLLLALSCGNADKDSDKGGTASEPATTTCASYCDRVMSACSGDNAVYINDEECLAVCALLEPGGSDESEGNTVACRTARARLAEREPEAYCSAAGPGGNDDCGSDCEAYCALYSQVCPTEAEAQGTDICIEQCATLVEQPGFDLIGDHQGDTVECRLVHVAAASLSPTEHCQHAQLSPTQPWCVADR